MLFKNNYTKYNIKLYIYKMKGYPHRCEGQNLVENIKNLLLPQIFELTILLFLTIMNFLHLETLSHILITLQDTSHLRHTFSCENNSDDLLLSYVSH